MATQIVFETTRLDDGRSWFNARTNKRRPAKAFDCAIAAERSARALCRIHGGKWGIVRTAKHSRKQWETTTIATVASDALDRIWTDSAAVPGQPALL